MKNSLRESTSLENIGTVETVNYSILCSMIVIVAIEQKDKNGRTPIMIAAMLNKHRKMEILVDVYTSKFTYTISQ